MGTLAVKRYFHATMWLKQVSSSWSTFENHDTPPSTTSMYASSCCTSFDPRNRLSYFTSRLVKNPKRKLQHHHMFVSLDISNKKDGWATLHPTILFYSTISPSSWSCPDVCGILHSKLEGLQDEKASHNVDVPAVDLSPFSSTSIPRSLISYAPFSQSSRHPFIPCERHWCWYTNIKRRCIVYMSMLMIVKGNHAHICHRISREADIHSKRASDTLSERAGCREMCDASIDSLLLYYG